MITALHRHRGHHIRRGPWADQPQLEGSPAGLPYVHRKAQGPRPSFVERYPYLTGLTLLLAFIGAAGWLFAHQGCAHPVGNLIAFAMLVGSGMLLLLPVAYARLAPLIGSR